VGGFPILNHDKIIPARETYEHLEDGDAKESYPFALKSRNACCTTKRLGFDNSEDERNAYASSVEMLHQSRIGLLEVLEEFLHILLLVA
jgi:hypothetical protein